MVLLRLLMGPFFFFFSLFRTLTNWTLEFEKWAPGVVTIIYKGPPNSRRALQQEVRYGNFQVLLTTFEYIIKDRPVLSKIKWLNMIIDEGHRMKNTQSKLTTVLRQYYHSRYRLILTGTPLQVRKIFIDNFCILTVTLLNHRSPLEQSSRTLGIAELYFAKDL
jgi:SNF2-related domain